MTKRTSHSEKGTARPDVIETSGRIESARAAGALGSPPRAQRPVDATLESWLGEELGPVAAESGCEIAHVSFRGGRLQVVLDHPEGVTLEHCEATAREVSAILDREDYGKKSYVLEVTSPGLDRQLYRFADYARFRGRKSRVTYRPSDGKGKVTVVGVLDLDPVPAAPADAATLEQQAEGTTVVVTDEAGQVTRIPYRDIQLTRLEIDL
jgi:ribosome maturation factor RimP